MIAPEDLVPAGTVDTDLAVETAIFWLNARDIRWSPDPRDVRASLGGMRVFAREGRTPRLRRLAAREIGRFAANPLLMPPSPPTAPGAA